MLPVLSPHVTAQDATSLRCKERPGPKYVRPGQSNALCSAEPSSQKKVTNLKGVIVTGTRASISNAIALKQDNEGITDSIVSEGIGKLSDDNVAAALQRITGVQVARGAAKVSTVMIRGQPNVAPTINGRDIFTTTGRSVSLSDIPADLVESVTVSKTSSAKDISGGIGRLINIPCWI